VCLVVLGVFGGWFKKITKHSFAFQKPKSTHTLRFSLVAGAKVNLKAKHAS